MDFFENDYPVQIKDFQEMFGLSEATPYQLINRLSMEHRKQGKNTYISTDGVREYRRSKKKSFRERRAASIIAMYMRKGGVGKTTLLFNLAIRACMYGLKVLIIDLDSQANISRSFRIDEPKLQSTFANIFIGETTALEAVKKVKKNLHIIPANNKLTRLSTDIDPMLGFKQYEPMLKPLKEEYDLILVDCPGLMDIATFMMLASSDSIISPAFPDDYSDEGLELTMEEIKKLEAQGFSPQHHIVLNRLDPNFKEKATKEYAKLFRDIYPNVTKTYVRKSQQIINAQSEGKSIFEFAYDNEVAHEIAELYKEIVLPLTVEKQEQLRQ